ncbi:hypothetical protein [Carnobacterium mobile]|uniref:hypothetical protein n=1 Tax=Carnobacterium mobile TaxID=2750 RepID=UPI00068A4C3D
MKELQPNYLNDQLNAAASDITKAGKEILLDTDQTDQIIKETTDSLQQYVDTITKAADDKEAIAVNKNTDLTQQEADEAADATEKSSIWEFAALILGMVLTSVAGLLGSKFVADQNEERM